MNLSRKERKADIVDKMSAIYEEYKVSSNAKYAVWFTSHDVARVCGLSPSTWLLNLLYEMAEEGLLIHEKDEDVVAFKGIPDRGGKRNRFSVTGVFYDFFPIETIGF